MNKILIAARALIKARSTSVGLKQFPDNSGPLNVEEAFAIQDAILEQNSKEIGAWKVGPASEHFPPTCAAIFRENLKQSPAKLSNLCRLKGIECEVAFELNKDLPPETAPYSISDVRDAVGSAMVAIEAVETRFQGWPVENPLWALADSQSNEALIVGEKVPLTEGIDLGKLQGLLKIDETVIVADNGFPGGNPFSLIAWLAEHLATRSPVLAKRGLKRGDIITTGSWNGVDFAANNSSVLAEFSGMGTAKLRYF